MSKSKKMKAAYALCCLNHPVLSALVTPKNRIIKEIKFTGPNYSKQLVIIYTKFIDFLPPSKSIFIYFWDLSILILSASNNLNTDTALSDNSSITRTNAIKKPYPWIISKNFDFFLVCGGAVWLLLGLNYVLLDWTVPISATQGPLAAQWLMIAILFGQHLSADAHNAATYMRIYGSNEDRQHFHFYGKWFAFACLPIFLIGISSSQIGGTMVYLYLITVFWHYAAQVFGICLIYCYKQNYKLKKIEKEIFHWLILSMSAVVGLRILTYKQIGPNAFGVPIPSWTAFPESIYKIIEFGFYACCVAFAVVIIKKAILEHKMIPWPAVLCFSTLALLGFSTGILNTMTWFYVPVFFHGSQYIAICLSYYLKERGLPPSMTSSQISSLIFAPAALKYLAMIIMVGAFLYIVIPHFFQSIGFDYALVAGVVLATVNFHHFNTDAAIWRLQDPRCREILLA